LTGAPSESASCFDDVDAEPAEPPDGRISEAVELAPTQDRAHAAQELHLRERLGDVVVSADLEAEHAAGLGIASGEHDDRDGALGPQPAADLGGAYYLRYSVPAYEIRRRSAPLCGSRDCRIDGLMHEDAQVRLLLRGISS
jgi:hypothetical protein